MPDREIVSAFLARAARRSSLLAALNGAATGLLIAVLFARVPIVGLALAAIGAGVGYGFERRRRWRIADEVERRAPECRNIVVTASALAAQRIRTRPDIAPMIYEDAARAVAALDERRLFPARRPLVRLVASGAMWGAAVALVVARPTLGIGAIGSRDGAGAIGAIEVLVTPPAYSGYAPASLRDPARIDVLEGSRVRITVRGSATSVRAETVAGAVAFAPAADGGFVGELIADADGFVAIDARTGDSAGVRRLIGLSVARDAAPRVRVRTPGRDLMYETAPPSIDVTLEATDDLGLRAVTLRYTKVSGSGEQFTFVEGEVPLTVQRTDARAWVATGTLPIASLSLARGDVVVYRGVASDHRPGAPPAESDAFLVELTDAGAGAAGGFAVDDENDRYGVSQQMVILMTERLLAARPRLDAEQFERESRTLAAAQRRVRAEFVFMLGGELADDVAEGGLLELDEHAHAAADEDEAIAGRLANQNRIELLRAIRAMSRAATALNETDPTRALPAEREALTLLQRAFSRSRYILRTLSERERLDFSRRLTGSLTGAVGDARAADAAPVNARIAALRAALADAASLAGAPVRRGTDANGASALAQRVLAIDPSSPSLQSVAQALAQGSEASARGDAAAARGRFEDAAIALATVLRADLRPAPRDAPSLDERQMAGALADALAEARAAAGGAR